MIQSNEISSLSQCKSVDIFWGEIAPSDHLVHVYPDESAFLKQLRDFIVTGIGRAESIILILTAEHRLQLEALLIASGLDLEKLRQHNQYLALDAEETLSRFMRGE